MRTMAAAALIVAVSGMAIAQTPGSSTAANKGKPAVVIKPAAKSAPASQTPSETASAMAAGERQALQSDLAWVGTYNGVINGEVSDRTITAIKTFQKDKGGKPTGVLNPQERATLAAAAKTAQGQIGWKIGLDPVNGIKLGLPSKLAPLQSTGATGSRWTSAQGQIQIETWRNKDSKLTIAGVADREKKEPSGRKVEYSAVKPDFFVISGTQGLKKFYVRGQIKDGDVRGLTILYDQATEGTMAPVVVAMSSAFAPFGAVSTQTSTALARKTVEYATGTVVSSDGVIATDRNAVDGCQVIVIPGYGNAERIFDDADHQLALLRIYGASGLKAVTFVKAAAKSDVTITGIADPQNQAGGSAVANMAAHVIFNGGDMKIDPAPATGFSGAAITDSDGGFMGMALLKPLILAGTPSAATAQTTMVPADVVRGALERAGIAAAASSEAKPDIKAAALRVICVRK